MPAIYASAPGKIILFGEHAVVYGRPAVAVPVTQVKARAVITPNPLSSAGVVQIDAPDVELRTSLDQLRDDHPLKIAIQGVFSTLNISKPPSLTIRITSTIPLASGLGSGAAVSVAIVRALSAFLGKPLPDELVSDLAYQVEKAYHGTPSGIDNTVITYAKPIFFVRGQSIQFIEVKKPFTILIGDTGVKSRTAEVVGAVRHRWQAEPAPYEQLFDEIGAVARESQKAVQSGEPGEVGPLMNRNHALLQKLGVSSPELDRLVSAALEAGADGSKLSGAGWGGNMIAIAGSEKALEVEKAIIAAGASGTIVTTVG